MKLIKFQIFLIFINNSLSDICPNYDEKYKCLGNQAEFPDSWDNNCFQTPPRNDIFGNYKSSYQDMHYLVGYAQLKYSSDKKSCDIIFITKVNSILGKEGEDYKIIYKFGDIEQENNILTITSDNSYPEGMEISARIINNKNFELVKLVLDNIYFIWDNIMIEQDSKYENGKKGVIVELFGWPYDDIAEECEFLKHAGYLGVKIYQPNESILTYESVKNGDLNPWFYLYETVSYRLISRMGDKKQLKNMINICRKNKIRVYSEVVINHMCENGNDMYKNHINNDCSSWGYKTGSAGSPFWTTKGLNNNNIYTNLEPVPEFPAVPYFASDFHCYQKSGINKYDYLNYLWVNDFLDLNTEKEYVQQRISDFLTELVSIGISGFSINAVTFMKPENYIQIFKKLKINLGNEMLPEDFLIYFYFDFTLWYEINDMICNNGTNYGDYFTKLLIDNGFENDINKFKMFGLGYLNDLFPICDGKWINSEERYILSLATQESLVPEKQDVYIYYKNLSRHKSDNIKILKDSTKNWKIKIIFSSYSLFNGSMGIPDGKSDCSKCKSEQCKKDCKNSVPFQKAYNPLSIGYDSGDENNWKEGTYIRMHRDIDIVNAMREWMGFGNFTEDELFREERHKAECDESCLICNEESKELNLCIYCNIEKGYYPIFYGNIYDRYHECIHKDSNTERLYFDSEDNYYKPCYETCRTCNKAGSKMNHNCLSCDINYIFRLDEIGKNNCVVNCTNPYYFNAFGQYKCSDTPKCPEEAKFFIKEKNKCINDCKNDDIYIYENNGYCLTKQSFLELNNTSNIIDLNKTNKTYFEQCELSQIEFEIKYFMDQNYIESLVKDYSEKYYYTNNHILQFKNDEYNFIIYKNQNCIIEFNLDLPKIDFGECYTKTQEYYSINDSLIIATMDRHNKKGNPLTTNSFFNPNTNKKLNVEIACKDKPITIEENITSFIYGDKNYELLIYLTKKNINILNPLDQFYIDLCYDIDLPINKDISLKDRLLTIYPNITLCDIGCDNQGINLNNMTAICKCQFNDIINNDILKDNFILNNIVDEIYFFFEETNLNVLKCYKYIFKYFAKFIGGYIVIFLIIIQIIFTVLYYIYDLYNIKKYIRNMTQNYIDYLFQKNKENKRKNEKNILIKEFKSSSRFNKDNNKNDGKIKLNINYSKKKPKYLLTKHDKGNKQLYINKSLTKSKESSRKNMLPNSMNKNQKIELIQTKEKKSNKINFKEYLSKSLDDLDYDDAMKKENRNICVYIGESIKDNQVIAKTFFSTDPLKPITIKLIIFNLNILLYFVINGMYFNEDYISKVYHIDKEEKFFSFIPRSINRLLYSIFSCLAINFIEECFEIEEKKLKGIFIREKNDSKNLKKEISSLIKLIKRRYLSLIIISFIIFLVSFYYILCFNYVYRHTQIEWIKSTFFIIILLQIISILACILEAILRYLSFLLKSEKLFKISKLLI